MLWFGYVTTGSCLLAPAGGTILESCGILRGGAWREEQVAGEDFWRFYPAPISALSPCFLVCFLWAILCSTLFPPWNDLYLLWFPHYRGLTPPCPKTVRQKQISPFSLTLFCQAFCNSNTKYLMSAVRAGCRHQAWDTETMQICVLEWQNGQHRGRQGDPVFSWRPSAPLNSGGKEPSLLLPLFHQSRLKLSTVEGQRHAPTLCQIWREECRHRGSLHFMPWRLGSYCLDGNPWTELLEWRKQLRVWHNSTTQSPWPLLGQASRPVALKRPNAGPL